MRPCSRHQSAISSSVRSPASGASTTTAHARSPRSGSGSPTTATSAIFGVRVEDVLDLLGRDVLALADDDVLEPAGDDQVAVGVETAEVAGVEEAVGVEGVGVERRVDVAHEQLRARGRAPRRRGRAGGPCRRRRRSGSRRPARRCRRWSPSFVVGIADGAQREARALGQAVAGRDADRRRPRS